jgi:hypothetical protein
MKYLLLLMATILCSCGHPEEATTGYVKEKGYKLIEENPEWKVYQVNDSCLLAVPNYNNRDAKPVI